jgi:hypothetical protein
MKPESAIRAILFDIGWTLIDPKPTRREAVEKYLISNLRVRNSPGRQLGACLLGRFFLFLAVITTQAQFPSADLI